MIELIGAIALLCGLILLWAKVQKPFLPIGWSILIFSAPILITKAVSSVFSLPPLLPLGVYVLILGMVAKLSARKVAKDDSVEPYDG